MQVYLSFFGLSLGLDGGLGGKMSGVRVTVNFSGLGFMLLGLNVYGLEIICRAASMVFKRIRCWICDV